MLQFGRFAIMHPSLAKSARGFEQHRVQCMTPSMNDNMSLSTLSCANYRRHNNSLRNVWRFAIFSEMMSGMGMERNA
jgi:hypothetical protein